MHARNSLFEVNPLTSNLASNMHSKGHSTVHNQLAEEDDGGSTTQKMHEEEFYLLHLKNHKRNVHPPINTLQEEDPQYGDGETQRSNSQNSYRLKGAELQVHRHNHISTQNSRP